MLSNYWIYILHCKNGAYYTGYTTNLTLRYTKHLRGKGSKYTRSFTPTHIAQSWKIFCEKSFAMKVEIFIKKLSKKEKEKLINYPEHLSQLLRVI
ncbi:MAG: GIY-YIG nuclease family protein [Gammaproteobacteria bacterium]|nr:GIY-YIG nuclease family protein [Gammaproteobacteria bacterium]